MPARNGDPLSVAAHLAKAAGLAEPMALEPLAGGRNNRVYRVALADGRHVVLKTYHVDSRDDRDRLAAEWSFVAFAWENGVRDVPRPLARDDASHSAIYSFAGGRKLGAGEICADHVAAALDFICRLNLGQANPSLTPAAEACFAFAQHIAAVDRRIARIATVDAAAPLREDAQRFIDGCLVPAWKSVRERCLRAAKEEGVAMDAALSRDQICISPSDFGFHNALLREDRVFTFLDFEYAGLDDPTKLVCDFFCQPEVPAPLTHYDRFVSGLSERLELAEAFKTRCRLLLDPYRIKWLCIMLNDFQPVDSVRRQFAASDARADRCARQLEKAAMGLGRIRAR